jgi:hypothetical protein
LLLAFFDVVMFARFICDSASARTHGAADQGTFTAPQQAAHHSSSDRRPTHDFRARMVAMVAFPLSRNCPAMTTFRSSFLARRNQGKGEH